MATAKEDKQSMLSQIMGERDNAKKKELREKLKGLVGEHEKAFDVLRGIEAKIADVIAETGENPDGIIALLRGD